MKGLPKLTPPLPPYLQSHSSPTDSAITSSGKPSLWMEKQQRSYEPSVLESVP